MAHALWILPLLVSLGLVEPLSIGSRAQPGISSIRDHWLLPQNGNHDNVRSHRHGNVNNDIYTAIVFGNGHIITYDGVYYKYPMDTEGVGCPHILSRDHLAYRFTILQNRQSLTLYTPRSVVTLHHNNKVEANNTGTYRDLPLQMADNSLYVTHDNAAVTIATGVGVRVECDMSHEECVFSLDAEFFNQTMGLLGSNDLDPSNDLHLRSGVRAPSVQDFVNYYELTGAAFCRPMAPPSPPTCGSHLTTRCQALLGDRSSTLAPCYRTVDPQPYREACMYDTTSCSVHNKPEAVCATVRAYVKMCAVRGVTVYPPSHCAKCGLHGAGAVWSERPHRKLDVVIATTLAGDLLGADLDLGGMIQSTFGSVEGHLRRQAGVQNVRVGLMGYGGEGALYRPHVYTFQGEPFTRHYTAALWRDKLASLSARGPGSPTDMASVLRAVLRYPWRGDAVKMVVVISGEDKALSIADMDSLTAALTSRGIVTNMLTTGAPFRSPDVLGVSSSSRLLLDSHTQRNAYVDFPMDLSSQLVQSTGGALFDLSHIALSSRRSLYHLGNEITRQISHSRGQCRSCRCDVAGYNGPATVICDTRRC